MKKSRILLVAALVLIMSVMVAHVALADDDDVIVIYAQVPDDWGLPRAWAWGGSGGDAFDSWPGGLMTADVNNPGWYFIHIPADMTGALINGQDGDVQTGDFEIDGQPVWVTVASADDFTHTTDKQTDGDLPPFVGFGVAVVYAFIPDDWSVPGIWAWGPRGNAFDNWPGQAMAADADNPGWFYAHIPFDSEGVIINANEGGTQTDDIAFPGTNVWITIADDGSFEITTEKQTTGDLQQFFGEFYAAPIIDLPVINLPDIVIKVHAVVPANWGEPGVWAWNDGDGYGDVFRGWPGEAFSETEGEWHIMWLPYWIDHIIINANNGSIQTEDIPVTVGEDIWIVVFGDERNEYVMSHEPLDPDGEFEVVLPELPPPVTITAPDTPTPPTPAPEPVRSGPPVGLIIGIIAAVAVVVGVAVFIIIKKKQASSSS